jgi:hypothetical protein
MTPDYLAFVRHGLAAERVGDAETALEYHRGVPLFNGSPHRAVLAQLAGLAEEMTPWLWGRWAAYQCTRAEDDGTRSITVLRTALEYTVNMFYERQLHDAYVDGDDPIALTSRVLGEDWAFHQVCTYELQGLATFLADLADGRLEENSDLARTWVDARMGGYRVEEGPGLFVSDPTGNDSLELLDLGASIRPGRGRWVIGRVVPSGTTPEWMFDTRPLPVDERTAREVAAGTGRGEWVGPLKQAVDDGRVGLGALRIKYRCLATDLPGRSLIEAGTAPRDLERTLRQFRAGRDEVGRAAFRILRAVADGTFVGTERAPCVAAAVLDAHAHGEARRSLIKPGQQDHWRQWAALVPEPARGRLRRFADSSGKRAA